MPGKPVTTDDIYNDDMGAIYGVAEPAEEEEEEEPAEEEAPAAPVSEEK